MNQGFRIIQLSDCHVSADPEALYRGINPRQAFLRVMDAALRWQPDLFLVTGDLSEDYSGESYAWLAEQLLPHRIPVLTTPGNHDLPGLQKDYFQQTATDVPLVREARGWKLIVINSSIEGEVPGALTDTMRAGLEQALGEDDAPKLVALHHQPVLVGSLWIDRYPLREPERLWSLLDGRPDVRAVVWGHVHQPCLAERGGIRLMGAPSTAANSLPHREEFTHDAAGPGCRWLRLGRDGRLVSGVLRTGDHSGPGQQQPENDVDQYSRKSD